MRKTLYEVSYLKRDGKYWKQMQSDFGDLSKATELYQSLLGKDDITLVEFQRAELPSGVCEKILNKRFAELTFDEEVEYYRAERKDVKLDGKGE